jgi:hypothetical protein
VLVTRASNRLICIGQLLQFGQFETAQNKYFCRLVDFRRMRGEVQQPRTVAFGHEDMEVVCGTVGFVICMLPRKPVWSDELADTPRSILLAHGLPDRP